MSLLYDLHTIWQKCAGLAATGLEAQWRKTNDNGLSVTAAWWMKMGQMFVRQMQICLWPLGDESSEHKERASCLVSLGQSDCSKAMLIIKCLNNSVQEVKSA